MRNFLLIVLLLAAWTSCEALTSADIEVARHPICVCAADRTCMIAGVAATLISGQPVRDLHVVVRDAQSGLVVGRTTTDYQGYYSIEDIPMPKSAGARWELVEDALIEHTTRPHMFCGRIAIQVDEPKATDK